MPELPDVEGSRRARTSVGGLSRQRVERLWQAMDDVVRESLPTGRVPPAEAWLTGVRDQRDAHCPRCGARPRRATVAGRTTVWCGRCQRPSRKRTARPSPRGSA